MKYVLDTVIFNRILDGEFSLPSLPEGSAFVATRVQFEELKNNPGHERRGDLLRTFEAIDPEVLPASFALDIAGAGLDEGQWSQNDNARKLRADLEAKKSKFNNWHDALIAEVALAHGYGLITADRDLAAVARQHGIAVVDVA